MRSIVIERNMFYGAGRNILIVDFYCHKYKLVIEVDGPIHGEKEIKEYDDGRTHDIENLGIKILRFTNEEVINDIQTVKQRILNEINLILSPLQGVWG